MNKKIKFGIWTVLLIAFVNVVYAQSSVDNDGDGVCNWALNSNRYSELNLDTRNLGCYTDPQYDDICPGTRENSPGMRRGGINNGCADYQIQAGTDFWSIGLGKYSPASVKVNWLLDQTQGVEFYQEIKLSENQVTGRETTSIVIENIRFSCDSGQGVVLTAPIAVGNKGENVIGGSYKGGEETVYNRGEKSAVLKLRLSRQSEDRVGTKLPGSDKNTIDQIRFNCQSIITQNVGLNIDGESRNSLIQEIDPFVVVVPLSSLAIQPPQEFLDRGIVLAGGIVSFTDKIIPKLEFAYRFSLDKCKWAVKIVLGSRILGIFNDGFDKFAELIWRGPENLRNIGLTSDAFLLSGRSMCAYSVCPAQWCEFANQQIGDQMKDVQDVRKYPNGTAILDNEGKTTPYTTKIPKTYLDAVNNKIQNSLILSASCGCISGLVQNLYQLRATAENWRQCMEIARNTGVYVSDCEKVLQRNICEFVVEEYQVFGGDTSAKNLFGKLWDKLNSKFGKSAEDRARQLGKSTASKTVEAGQAQAQTNNAEIQVRDAKTFGRELADIGGALGQGSLGYQDASILRSFCSAAIYGRIPDFITDAGVDINKAIISTQVSGNWRTGVAYTNIENKPIYEYEISWMVVAGKDNTRYSAYLRTPEGTKRILDGGNGIIALQGDFRSDYIQITDTTEYIQLCLEIESDPAASGCYPPGKFATSGIKKDIDLFFGEEDKIMDKDGDRLPDDWESKYHCHSGRIEYLEEQDKNACIDLIKLGRVNLLNPNNPNSDGDGIRDDKEDSDGDGWDNYQEYLNGGNPNVAGQKTTGELIESACSASFESFSLSGGSNDNGVQYYKPGDNILIRLANDRVYDKTLSSEVVVRTTITGVNVAQVSDILLEGAKGKDVIVWKVPSDADSGDYGIKVELVTLKDLFGANLCAGVDRTVSRKESQILIYNPLTVGCLESDGGRDIGVNSICMDSLGVHREQCNVNTLSEYLCKDNKCQLETVQCSGLNPAWTCIPPGLCGQKCFDNDPDNDLSLIGSCRDEKGVHNDKCTEQGVLQYQCNPLGICEESISQCPIGTICEQQSREIIIPEINYRKYDSVGACVLPGPEIDTTHIPPEQGVQEIDLTQISDKKVKDDIQNTIINLKKSGGDNILDIIIGKVDAKNTNNIKVDPKLILALITVESRGNQNAVSKDKTGKELAYGVLQIYHAAHTTSSNVYKYNKQSLKSDINYNLDAGLEIFYNNLKVSTSTPIVYKNAVNKYCSSSKSSSMNTKFLGYTGANAALRMYNGFSCKCPTCDDNFVEKVSKYYQGWLEATAPPVVVAEA